MPDQVNPMELAKLANAWADTAETQMKALSSLPKIGFTLKNKTVLNDIVITIETWDKVSREQANKFLDK